MITYVEAIQANVEAAQANRAAAEACRGVGWDISAEHHEAAVRSHLHAAASFARLVDARRRGRPRTS